MVLPRPGLSSVVPATALPPIACGVEQPGGFLPGMSAAGGLDAGSRAMSSQHLPDYARRGTGKSRHAADDTGAAPDQHVALRHRHGKTWAPRKFRLRGLTGTTGTQSAVMPG
jgi:hypothetical protein